MQFDVYAFQDEVIIDFAQNTFFIQTINLCNFFHQLLRFLEVLIDCGSGGIINDKRKNNLNSYHWP